MLRRGSPLIAPLLHPSRGSLLTPNLRRRQQQENPNAFAGTNTCIRSAHTSTKKFEQRTGSPILPSRSRSSRRSSKAPSSKPTWNACTDGRQGHNLRKSPRAIPLSSQRLLVFSQCQLSQRQHRQTITYGTVSSSILVLMPMSVTIANVSMTSNPLWRMHTSTPGIQSFLLMVSGQSRSPSKLQKDHDRSHLPRLPLSHLFTRV